MSEKGRNQVTPESAKPRFTGHAPTVVLSQTTAFVKRNPWAIALALGFWTLSSALGLVNPWIGGLVALVAFFVGLLYPTSTRHRDVEREVHPPR